MQTTEELQASVDGMKEELRLLNNMAPATAEAKQQLSRQVNILQSELQNLAAQTDQVDSEIACVRADVDTQETKCEILQQMHEKMKIQNAAKSMIHTWPYVAFVDAAGSADGRITIAKSNQIMSTYLSPDIVVTSRRVREVLAELYPSTVSHIISHGLAVDQFCAVVEAIDTPTAASYID